MSDKMSRWSLTAALLAEAALAVVDIAAGSFARSLYLLPVLAMAIRAGARDVALTGAAATGLAVASPLWEGTFGDGFVLPLITVVSGSAIAVWGAREREAASRARARADVERRQLHLLAEAAHITDGAADIDEAMRRLLDLLVPDFADAAWIDLIGADGRIERLGARVHGPDAEELETWLMARGASGRAELSPTLRALRGEGSQLAELSAPLREAMTHGAADLRLMERSRLRWMMALPLAPSGGPLGALGLGVGHSGRHYGPEELAFADLLVGRAGLALANAQLVGRLTAAQRRLDGILGALAEAVIVHDADGRIAYANRAAATLLGLPDVHAVLTAVAGELVERFDLRDPEGRPVSEEELPGARVIRGETPEPLLTRSVLKTTGQLSWLLTKATPLEDEDGQILAVLVVEDVTPEHQAELRQRFLAEAGAALSSSLDYEETLQRVARLAVPTLADWCAVELPDDHGTLQQVALVHANPERLTAARELRERYQPDPDATVGTPAVMRTGEPQLIAELSDAMLAETIPDPERLQAIRALGIRSMMIVPMTSGGRVLGAMSFVFSESGRRYREPDVVFAQGLATRAATAIENARLYTERSEVAHTLQESLLPDALPDVPGWRFAADYRPGERGAEVGGDFYDVFPVAGGHMVLLGDVTGKGVTAAALTSLVRHTARTAAAFDPRPSSVLAVVNRALRERPKLAPVTMVSGLLQADRLTLAVGGHPLPLLKRGPRPCKKVGATGLLLGAVEAYPEAEDVSVALAPGDLLLLYTDGVTETPGADDRFGEERLRAAVDAAPADPAGLLAGVSAALDAFARGTVLDDRAVLVLQRI